MNTIMVSHGRNITESDIEFIRSLIRDHPSWNRTRLSEELCYSWGWRAANGRVRDMTCRSFLLKLHRRDLICLPPPQRPANNHIRNRSIPDILHGCDPVHCQLNELRPLQIVNALEDPFHRDLFKCLLQRYHYLGYQGSPGETLWYLIFDRRQRPLACLLFASAAWKIAPRDKFIQWDHDTRQRNLRFLTNNTRFLILPWVKVKCLASHILALIVRQIADDWQKRYQHSVVMLETFVDATRFRGTVYRAANWINIGQTQGRTRQDRTHTIKTTVKDIYLYPLTPSFRDSLNP